MTQADDDARRGTQSFLTALDCLEPQVCAWHTHGFVPVGSGVRDGKKGGRYTEAFVTRIPEPDGSFPNRTKPNTPNFSPSPFEFKFEPILTAESPVTRKLC